MESSRGEVEVGMIKIHCVHVKSKKCRKRQKNLI